jgi:trans-aconitate methyltransferase
MASTAVPPGARFAEAADRNKEPIAGVICPLLEDKMGVVVEVACGTGQHAAFFAQKLPGCQNPINKQALKRSPSITHDVSQPRDRC